MRFPTKISLITLTVVITTSCLKNDEYSSVPELTFISYNTFSSDGVDVDSAVYTFSFTDGDGDLGSDDSAVVNCFLHYYEKDADTMKLYPSFIREYRLPSLTPNAKNKAIDGEISLTLKPAPIFNPFNDSTYQWGCTVMDRAGNESNEIRTEIQFK